LDITFKNPIHDDPTYHNVQKKFLVFKGKHEAGKGRILIEPNVHFSIMIDPHLKIEGLVSAFLVALITDRAFLVDQPFFEITISIDGQHKALAPSFDCNLANYQEKIDHKVKSKELSQASLVYDGTEPFWLYEDYSSFLKENIIIIASDFKFYQRFLSHPLYREFLFHYFHSNPPETSVLQFLTQIK
jgi:hypothetical protein